VGLVLEQQAAFGKLLVDRIASVRAMPLRA
jgi:hypothetical protein